MKYDEEIFLPDTTVKYKVLKDKLKEVYGLEIMPKYTKYTYLVVILGLATIVLAKTIKKS